MSSGVLVAVSREGAGGLRTARALRAGRPAARTGLFRNGDAARGGAVLAGLRRDSRSALATRGAGPLDDSGGAVGHGSGTTGNRGRTGALPPRHHRRDDCGGSHRAPVTRADAARRGNVRGSGESADLRLVRVLATTRVPAAA
ncbi:hypothetical protein [Actinoplanes couchii]|uniref:hypothetical protein n=1 Tax=Actinoplanes couchii TaxID=403638 RepID=UPI00194047EE|nr:hypothetical protein [Actinoplanes couchii]MDR6326334.1 hypothetical protein [Actinoplanes couchii]